MMIKFKRDEEIIYEGIVNNNTKLTLTNKRMIFEKKRGLFKKKYRVVDTILIDNIKFYRSGGIRQKMSKVIIKTSKKDIQLKCSSVIDAKKIVDGIIYVKTGKNVIERETFKINNTLKLLKGCKDSIILIGGLILGIKKIIEERNDK